MRESFRQALLSELHLQIPNLGGLSGQQLADRILALCRQYLPPLQRFRIGQILWLGVAQTALPGGKRIEETELKPLILDLIAEESLCATTAPQLRTLAEVSLFHQAKAQGGLLTVADVAAVLWLCTRTVRKHLDGYQRSSGRLVPTRAVIHDIGAGVTHRAQICRRVVIEKQSVQQTARETHHSPQSVTRYLKDFGRVRYSLDLGFTIEQTAFFTGLSRALVLKYQALGAELAGHRQAAVAAEPTPSRSSQ